VFELPAEAQRELERARRFAETNLAGRDRTCGLDETGWRAAAELGVFRLALAGASRDRGGGALATFAMLEGLGRGGAGRGLLFALGAHLFGCLVPVSLYGAPIHAAQWEAKLRAGAVVGALAVTEPGGGSTLDNIETVARETAGGYLINGRKTLIGNAPNAGLFLVLARQFPDRGPLGLSAFLVPGGANGLSVSPIAAAGLPGAPIGNLSFSNCFVPAAAILGRAGAGLRIFSSAMQWERSCLLAGFLGAAERDLATCLEALNTKRDRGGSLLRHQAISHRLARMKLRLEGARLLAYRAAGRLDQGREDLAAAAMAKLAVSEAAVANAQECLQLLAGHAWQGEPIDLAGALNDTLGGLFASGTSEILLELVARSLQLEPAKAERRPSPEHEMESRGP
jgi:clorobiocin biosynthesis protein CloN3